MGKTFKEQFVEALEHGITHKAMYLMQFMKNEINEPYDYRSPLFWASRYGNEKVIQALREMGAVEEVDKEGMGEELLKILDIRVIDKNDEKRAIEMIKDGANLEKIDEDGRTALITASQYGHVEVLKTLLSRGAKVDEKDDKGYTALMTASVEGHVEIVKALLDAGAKVNKKDNDGKTALMEASQRGRVEVVKALLDAGAKVDEKDIFDFTALIFASRNGHVEVVKALLDAGAKVDYYNHYTALMKASEHGHVEVVKALLDAGAKVNEKDDKGYTALMTASNEGHVEVVKALLDAGAKVNEKDYYNGYTALMKASKNGHVEIVKALLDAGAKVDEKNNDGFTAINCTYRVEIREMLREAMEKQKEKQNEQALSDMGAVEVVDKEGMGEELLRILGIVAIDKNDEKRAIELIKDGANIEKKDEDGRTALMKASKYGCVEVVEALLDAGVKVDEKDNDGKTAIDFTSDDEIKKLLREALRKQKEKQNAQTFKSRRESSFGE